MNGQVIHYVRVVEQSCTEPWRRQFKEMTINLRGVPFIPELWNYGIKEIILLMFVKIH